MTEHNRYNPLLTGDPERLAAILVSMLPDKPAMTPEEQIAFEAQRKLNEEAYLEARNGVLPPNTYRILEQGGFVGWHLELEIDGTIVVLEGTTAAEGRYAVFDNLELATQLARAEVARRHNQEIANKAVFKRVWGGCL